MAPAAAATTGTGSNHTCGLAWPAAACGTEIEFYVSVETAFGVETSPDGAPAATFTVFSATSINTPFADDNIFGGLGGDFLHGGSGDDAISGAEALEHAYVPVFLGGVPVGVLDLGYDAFKLPAVIYPGHVISVLNPGNVLAYNAQDLDGQHLNNRFRAGEFFLYDEYDPLRRVMLTASGELWKSAADGVASNLASAVVELDGLGVLAPAEAVEEKRAAGA